MVRKESDAFREIRENMRGGNGAVSFLHLFKEDEMQSKCRLFAKLVIDPGGSIGLHPHDGEEEIFYVLSGWGVVEDDGAQTQVYPGDAVLTGGGKSHSIANIGDDPLEFLAIINVY